MSETSDRTRRYGNIEIRLNDDHTVDEVVVYHGDRCVLHVEQMSDKHWWAAMYDDQGNQVHMNWFSKRDISLNVEDGGGPNGDVKSGIRFDSGHGKFFETERGRKERANPTPGATP